MCASIVARLKHNQSGILRIIILLRFTREELGHEFYQCNFFLLTSQTWLPQNAQITK